MEEEPLCRNVMVREALQVSEGGTSCSDPTCLGCGVVGGKKAGGSDDCRIPRAAGTSA